MCVNTLVKENDAIGVFVVGDISKLKENQQKQTILNEF